MNLKLNLSEIGALRAKMKTLWVESDAIWDAQQNESDFELFVSAEYGEVFDTLAELRKEADAFLELGSGLGVITIMAQLLGYDAYGIESKSGLIEHSIELAEKFGAAPTFGCGNFFPDEYVWNAETHGTANYYDDETSSAYDEIGMSMEDFDVIYVYPWPDEHPLYLDLVRQCARPDAFFVRYDAREGIMVGRIEELANDA